MIDNALFDNPLEKLKKDQREAAKTLTTTEVRYLVDLYYQIQEFRKASGNQIGAMTRAGEPVAVLQWSFKTMEGIEKEINKWMDIYTDNEESGLGRWCKSITGIGPVLTAGLLAHIDINKAPTVGHIWNFAGLNPTITWEKGKKRPWNATLKLLCYKIGESFVKFQNHKDSFYGQFFVERRALEAARSEAGQFAEYAKNQLETRKIGKETTTYKAFMQGKLCDGQMHQRARRYAVKLFLSHYHAEAYRRILKQEPPKPFAIAILGHAHMIEAPNQDVV